MTANKIRPIFAFMLVTVVLVFSMCVHNVDKNVAYKKNKIESYLQKGNKE